MLSQIEVSLTVLWEPLKDDHQQATAQTLDVISDVLELIDNRDIADSERSEESGGEEGF